MRYRHSLVLIALAAAACQSPATHREDTLTPHTVDGTGVGSTSVHGSASAAASPVPTIAPPVALRAPLDGGLVLTGVIKIDPAYIVGQGAGNIVAIAGGSAGDSGGGNVLAVDGIVAAGGGNIVGQGAGNFVGHNGSAIVSQGAGNLIPNAASGVVANQGGAIVATGGGNIVAAGGGNIVGQGAGNIVAQGAGNAITRRHVLDAAASAPVTVARGEELPAAGMLVSVVSLEDHSYLPVGVGPDGTPVYVVYSDAKGGYKVYLPKGTTQNVMVVTSVPGTQDDHVTYNLVTPVKAVATPMTESNALVGRMAHHVMVERIAAILPAGKAEITELENKVLGKELPAPLRTPLTAVMDTINARAHADGLDAYYAKDPVAAAPVVNALAEELDDLMLSALGQASGDSGFDALQVLSVFYTDGIQAPYDESVQTALSQSIEAARQAAKLKLDGDKAWFDKTEILFQDGNDHVIPGQTHIPNVQTPTDPIAYVVDHYLAKNVSNTIFNTHLVYNAMGIPAPLDHPGWTYSNRIEAASYTLLYSLLQTISPSDQPERMATALARVDSFCKAHGIAPATATQGATGATGAAAATGATP